MSVIENKVQVNIPSKLATKQLSLQNCSTGKKLTISTNWLPLFGFEKGDEVIEEVIGRGKGLIIRPATQSDNKPKRVYQRTYRSRKNNPFETMLDIRSQKKINEAFPEDTVTVHVTFQQGKVTIVPVSTPQAERIKGAKNSKDLMNAFVACSSGVDALSLTNEGFRINTLLEWRPPEKRDKKRDYSETGALCAIENVSVKNLINEDIGNVDIKRLLKMTAKSTHTLFHCSIQCDDFSNLKTHSMKKKSLEDLSTSSDMVYDAMRLIEEFRFPAILIENVCGFLGSEMNALLETKLRRWGYSIHKTIAYSPEHDGYTGRKRYYLFATSFEVPFSWPEAKPAREKSIWSTHIAPHLHLLRDVSDSKSIQDGAKGGRLRVIDKASRFSPTILKSQNRMAKDSVVIKAEDGRYLFPDNEMLKSLMGIPKTFSATCVGATIESEIIGQSVDFQMHTRIIQAIKKHLERAAVCLFGRHQPSLSFNGV